MGQALYRKYRSKSLDEIIGQEHITDPLAAAVKNGRISHAYLFTGPRGTGKTSIARILAHEINELPYEHESNHIDIIEIDAASNRGIDEIRDLREKVYMAPASSKYKVYIIDEVHMLTPQAFNALLKTLEEPPAHAIFILATTEAHKLPDTIISRTQRHIFKPVPRQKVIDHLRHIAKTEKILIDDEALALFAAHGGGSFRDSISLLDQAGNSGQKVSLKVAESLLGIPPEEAIEALCANMLTSNTVQAMQGLENLQAQGYPAAQIAKRLNAQLRAAYVAGRPQFLPETQLALMSDLIDVAPAHNPTQSLELAILRAMPRQSVAAPPKANAETPAAPDIEPQEATREPTETIQPHNQAQPGTQKAAKAKTLEVPVFESDTADAPPAGGASDAVLDVAIWNDILNALKSKYNTLYGVMRMAVPEFSPGKLTMRFRFSFHQKRMNEAKHRKIVGDVIKELTGTVVAIECIFDKDAQLNESPIGSNAASRAAEQPTIPPESLTTISNIFGGGELLES